MVVPKHIGFILDGNRRYARNHGKPTLWGHKQGAEAVKKTLKACLEFGVNEVTVYAFSTENFKRDQEEVSYLMDLIGEMALSVVKEREFKENEVRFCMIGRKDLLSEKMANALTEAEEETKNYSKLKFNVCIAYGGRSEIVDACKKIAEKVSDGSLDIADIDESVLSENMYLSSEPDLVIRTSEQRLSGFLTWQSVYSEILFLPDNYWPEFDRDMLKKCLDEFANRKRKYGR